MTLNIRNAVKGNIKREIEGCERQLKLWRGEYDRTENSPHEQSHAARMIAQLSRELTKLKLELQTWEKA